MVLPGGSDEEGESGGGEGRGSTAGPGGSASASPASLLELPPSLLGRRKASDAAAGAASPPASPGEQVGAVVFEADDRGLQGCAKVGHDFCDAKWDAERASSVQTCKRCGMQTEVMDF